jgi:hypothetical protein
MSLSLRKIERFGEMRPFKPLLNKRLRVVYRQYPKSLGPGQQDKRLDSISVADGPSLGPSVQTFSIASCEEADAPLE